MTKQSLSEWYVEYVKICESQGAPWFATNEEKDYTEMWLDGVSPKEHFDAELRRGASRCGDCNVKPGELHTDGCDVERCASCGGQRLSCGCTDNCEDRIPWSGEWHY